jgi:hypothetical protein
MNLFYDTIEHIKKYDIYYPQNDIEAYVLYSKYSIVYNKLEIAKFQNLECNPFPIYPKKYPIISKPIINLNGMGKGAIKIKNNKEFTDNIESTNFWCSFLNGCHYSWDIILRKGKIIYSTCFFGKKLKLGTFIYWKQENKPLLENIKLILNHYLKDFTGNVNMETIGCNVIEVHLRMGDIKLTDIDIIKLALLNLNSNVPQKVINNTVKKINNKNIQYINLVPVWEKKFINFDIISNLKYNKIKQLIVPILNKCDMIIDYYIDSPTHPDPEGYKRWFLLLTYDLEYGLKLGKKIERIIKNMCII